MRFRARPRIEADIGAYAKLSVTRDGPVAQ
jgi:hypothetical protein